MKIFVDENIPLITVRELRDHGHDVLDIRGTELEGLSDEGIWEIAQDKKRILITTDVGFINKQQEKHYGIIVIRLKQPNRLKIHKRIMRAINLFNEEEWPGLTVIMRDTLYSIRRTKEKVQ
jgi:predicted nuclease of predicted toxin-antitoxin system